MVPEQQVDAALVAVRGTAPDRALVHATLRDMMEFSASAGACKVLYSGRVPGSVDSSPVPGGVVREPAVLVVACTTARGNTAFTVAAGDGASVRGDTRVRLDDRYAIFAVRGVRLTDATASALPGGGLGPGPLDWS